MPAWLSEEWLKEVFLEFREDIWVVRVLYEVAGKHDGVGRSPVGHGFREVFEKGSDQCFLKRLPVFVVQIGQVN